MTVSPQQAVDAANEVFGRHSGHRALHAKGLLCRGRFMPTARAAELSRATHMQQEVPVLARFSNGGGNPEVPDFVPDVRGLAVKFELSDGSKTDIVAQSLPWFAFSTPDGFVDFLRATKRSPAMLWRFPAYLIRNPRMIRALRVNMPALRPPESYVTCHYYGIHAFRWIDSGGGSRYVRYTWVPEAGDHRISPRQAKSRGRDYLQEEMRRRLADGPARFTLRLQIAGPGDRTDDPAARWPADREQVDAGTLEITSVGSETGVLVFDPTNVVDGIELSDDPVLRFRREAYSESVHRRAG